MHGRSRHERLKIAKGLQVSVLNSIAGIGFVFHHPAGQVVCFRHERQQLIFKVYAAVLIIHPVLIGIDGNDDFVAGRLNLPDRASAAGLFFVDRITARFRIIGKQDHD